MAAASLPAEVLGLLFAFLAPPEVAAAACVCKAWCAALADPALWQRAFLFAFGEDAAAEVARRAAPGTPDWRAAAADRYRTGAAWRDGRCRAHTLEGANLEGGGFRIVDDHLIVGSADGAQACASAHAPRGRLMRLRLRRPQAP